MTKNNSAKLIRLENDPLWREACDMAEHVYSLLYEMPADEKWATVSKMRQSANDLMFYVGQAVSNTVPVGAEYEWGNASKALGGLKTLYRFAGRQHFIELDPAIMVRLDKMFERIDAERNKATEKTKASEQHQLELWREQYQIWRKMNDQKFPEPKWPRAKDHKDNQ